MYKYIEAGAHDGHFQSNTLSLEQSGDWEGILIEPNLNNFTQCKLRRSTLSNKFYNCALVSNDHNDPEIPFFTARDHSAMDGVIKRGHINYSAPTTVEARTLQSILDEENSYNIDILFLDVEGFEIEVLKGINFKKCHIKAIQTEAHPTLGDHSDLDRVKKNIIDFMAARYYKSVSASEYPFFNSDSAGSNYQLFFLI